MLGGTIKDKPNEQRMVGDRKPYSIVVEKPEGDRRPTIRVTNLAPQDGGNHDRFTAQEDCVLREFKSQFYPLQFNLCIS